MAREKASYGPGAKVLWCRRQSLDSYDLEYTVRSAAGVENLLLSRTTLCACASSVFAWSRSERKAS